MANKLKSPHLLLHLRLFCSDHSSSWACSIKKAAESCSPVKALQLYATMHRRQPARYNSLSLLFALKSCAHLPDPDRLPHIRHLHAHLLKLGFSDHLFVATGLLSAYAATHFRDACLLFDEMPSRSSVTWNIMITAYSRQGNIKAARLMFDTMPHPNQASWSTMIAAYIDNSLLNHGLTLFRLMIMPAHSDNHFLQPDQLTLGPILVGCARVGCVGLPLGKSIHAFAVKNKWELNVQLGTCLVDMYAKCGLLKNAALIFDMIKDRNVVVWTAFICGAAQHGYGQEALHMFRRMRAAGVKPNELTFTGILTACVQTGLVDEGRRCFAMLAQYGLRPRIQHFGCMVDLFGKAGLVDKAYEVINTMPYKANLVVWASFLSSCKLHKQFRLVDEVIDKVMPLVRPEHDGGVCSIISDIYVLCGRTSEAERIREFMLVRKVRKVRASSFITSFIASELL